MHAIRRHTTVIAIAAFIALAVVVPTATTASATTTCSAPSATAPGPFSTNGDTIHSGTHVWIPEGLSVSGLEHDGPTKLRHYSYEPSWRSFRSADLAQISAAANAWCSNVIRLQVSERMVDSGIVAFRTQLATEVHTAESDGMAVVINDQTQWDVNGQGDVVTKYTYRFWRIIAGLYGNDPHVIFDLLNEPHGAVDSSGAVWHSTFQPLVTQIRKVSTNQIWAEGPRGAGDLSTINGHLLAGGNLVYAVHHPNGVHTPANWMHDYGYLLAEGHPVVDGEWSNWVADGRPECWPDAPTAVPAYLQWLQQHGIGMTAWAIGWDGGEKTPGIPAGYTGPAVLASSDSYSTPTAIDPATWNCAGTPGQSAGADIQAMFVSEDRA